MKTNQNKNIKRIHTTKKSMFRYWLEFLKPYHKMRTKEIEVLSLMLYYRYELSREIQNSEMVDTVLFSTKTRLKIRSELDNMGQRNFNNILTALRNKNVLSKENKITNVLIPNMTEDGFQLIFDFEIKK